MFPRSALLLALLAMLPASCTGGPAETSDEAVAAELGLTVQQVRRTTAKKLLTNSQLLALPGKLRDATVVKARRPTGAQDAAAWRLMTMRDERGSIPHDAQLKAAAEKAQLGTDYALKDYGSRLYRSVDGGQIFTEVSQNAFFGTQGWYDNALFVAPHPRNTSVNDDVVIAGGIDLWRSVNGGLNFTKVSDWAAWPRSVHADQHIILAHPGYNGTSNREVWVGNDGGAWMTLDILGANQSSGWFRRNTGLGITQFYGGSTNAGIVIGGTQDNGTPRRDARTTYNTWTVMQGGDGGFCASDPTDPNIHYGEFQNGVPIRIPACSE